MYTRSRGIAMPNGCHTKYLSLLIRLKMMIFLVLIFVADVGINALNVKGQYHSIRKIWVNTCWLNRHPFECINRELNKNDVSRWNYPDLLVKGESKTPYNFHHCFGRYSFSQLSVSKLLPNFGESIDLIYNYINMYTYQLCPAYYIDLLKMLNNKKGKFQDKVEEVKKAWLLNVWTKTYECV